MSNVKEYVKVKMTPAQLNVVSALVTDPVFKHTMNQHCICDNDLYIDPICFRDPETLEKLISSGRVSRSHYPE